jgi:cell wall assembly regulator SMI1
MRNDVAATWAAIEAWAEGERPELLENLRGPASAADIATLRGTGLPIPGSLLASLAIHDGEEDGDGGFFPQGGRWLSAAEMVSHRDMLREALADFDEGDVRPSATIGPVDSSAFRESRLPIIDMNGDVTWYLDFAPPTGGTTGQVVRLDPECGEFVVCAPDFATFLAMYREDLAAGRIGTVDEDADDEDKDAEILSGPWPPLSRLPSLQKGVIGEAEVRSLGEMGRWAAVRALADRLPPSPGLLTRVEARAAQNDGDWKKALRALDKLAKDGHENDDDAIARIDVLEHSGKAAQALAAAEASLAARPFAALHVRHAELVRTLAEEAPVRGRKAQLEWHASPAGQQAGAKAREIAIAGYDAALALEDRFEWRCERIEILIEGERWEEAEADAAALVAKLADDASASDDNREKAQSLLEQAQARGEGENEGMLGSLDEMLAGFAEMMGDKDSKALGELKELREAFAGIMDKEAVERAELDADPDSTNRRAREVAESIAKLHADVPERFAPFDAATLDAKARRWYDAACAALLALGFEAGADVEPLRNTEMSGRRVLVRVLFAADRRTCASLYRLQGPFMAVEVVECESALADGRILMTNNTGTSNPFEQPAGIELLALPLGTKPGDVLKAHRARIEGQATQAIADMGAVLELQERQRLIKREAARARGWVSDSELRSMLGASYRELAGAVRAELATRL